MELILLKRGNSLRKSSIFASLLLLFVAVESFACVMVPSVWKTIDSSTEELQSPSVYALAEAFMQFKKKFAKEMKVCNIPVKAFMLRSLLLGKEGKTINKETYLSVKEALEQIFNDVIIPEFEKLPKESDIFSQQSKDSDEQYYLDLYVSDSKTTYINMIDLNMQIWALLRLVVRDEVTVYVRVSDCCENLLFLDEFKVSPTIVIDPLITPIGGFIETFEKNDSKPVHVDWGSVGDSKEHVLRVNTSFYAPSDVPPLDIFKSDLAKSLEKDERDKEACNQLIYAIKTGDTSLVEVILDTYSNSSFDVLDDEGKAPIHYAALSGLEEMVKKLLEKKANLSLIDKQGNNALHLALKSEKVSIPICELLVKSGIDLNAKNSDGKTPLDLAAQKGISLKF